MLLYPVHSFARFGLDLCQKTDEYGSMPSIPTIQEFFSLVLPRSIATNEFSHLRCSMKEMPGCYQSSGLLSQSPITSVWRC